MHLSALLIYPVKSLRGCAVNAALVEAMGLADDRRFMIVDEDGRFLTQRTLPRLALIATALSPDTLTLSADGAGKITLPRRPPSETAIVRHVTIWKSEGLAAEDCGDSVAAWLSAFLDVRCRLVFAGSAFHRPVRNLPPTASLVPSPVVGFADAYPLLVISETSLAELNDRLIAKGEVTLPMNRFRPNLVIADCPAYAEDTWNRFRIGEAIFRAAGPCARCVVTTTDQSTAERGFEPLRTLATYRRNTEDPSYVNFGQNLIPENTAVTLRCGDPVEVLA